MYCPISHRDGIDHDCRSPMRGHCAARVANRIIFMAARRNRRDAPEEEFFSTARERAGPGLPIEDPSRH